jgi:hypothetical protein
MRGGSCDALHGAWLYGVGLVARWLACGGLSDACRRPSPFSLLAQREGTKRNGLSSPPTLQALALEGLGTDRTLPVRPTATPHRRRSLRPERDCCRLPLFACSNVAEPPVTCHTFCSPHRHSGAGRNPVAGAVGRRDNRTLTSLDPGLRRDDEQKQKRGGSACSKSQETPHRNIRHAGAGKDTPIHHTSAPPSVDGDGAVWPFV